MTNLCLTLVPSSTSQLLSAAFLLFKFCNKQKKYSKFHFKRVFSQKRHFHTYAVFALNPSIALLFNLHQLLL